MGKRKMRGAPPAQESRRGPGAEVKAIKWAVRHPLFTVVPGAGATAVGMFGWESAATWAGSAAGCAAVLGTGWYRAHPDSWDTFAAPTLRRLWRRWFCRYVGRRWRAAMEDADLITTARKSGATRVPRVLRVRAYTAQVDTVYVRMAPGQAMSTWEAALPVLTEALGAERIGIEKVKPRVIALTVQRRESFTEIIDAPDMPEECDAVDLTSVYLGDTELGADWRDGILGQHWFVAGAAGAGKNSIGWSLLRAIAPLIRDGLVRLWVCDPKQMEFSKLAAIAHRYADAVDDPDDEDDDENGQGASRLTCAALIEEYVADMAATQKLLKQQGKRRITVSRETPLNLLIIDELGALTAYSQGARLLNRSLALVGSQGRASGHAMLVFVQEPSKDVVPIRDLFTVRFALRLTSSAHPDMVLGEDARLRGALADEIPNSPDTAGVGYVIRQRSRAPMRVRAAYVTDDEADELIRFCQAGNPGPATTLKVVA